ncbi:MAG: hypothetical protein IJY25_02255, partial [Bacilli bacterium]|nr:hypothetical protein [Bacilli bacterium]
TGVEVYASTASNGTYEKVKTVLVDDLIDGEKVTVLLKQGQHLYYKVRTYVKNSAGTFYSGYSNIIDLDYSLTTPTITRTGFGMGLDGAGMDLKLEPVGEITGVEVYASSSETGNYILNKTVLVNDLTNGDTLTVAVQKDQHLYFKVRTYVKNSAGTFYSGYSNIIDLKHSS